MRLRILAVLGVVLVLPSLAHAQRWGRDRFPQSGACFYRDAYFEGDYFCVRAGDEVPGLPDELNDEISSILVFGRAEVTIFVDSRFRGPLARFNYSVDDLRDYDWNDRISSLRVDIDSRFDSVRGRDPRDDRRDDRRGDRQ